MPAGCVNTRRAYRTQVWRPFITRVAHDASGSPIVAARLSHRHHRSRSCDGSQAAAQTSQQEVTLELGRHGRVRGLRGVRAAVRRARSCRRARRRARSRCGSRCPAEQRYASRVALPAHSARSAATSASSRFEIPAGPLRDRAGRDRANLRACSILITDAAIADDFVPGRVRHLHAARGNRARARRHERHVARDGAEQRLARDSARVRSRST